MFLTKYGRIFLFTLPLLASTALIPEAHANSCSIVTTSTASLESAKTQFAQVCPDFERHDCDPVSDDRWMCSSELIDADTIVQATPQQPSPDPEDEILEPDNDSPDSDSISQVCMATGPDLSGAISAYAFNCTEIPRSDCDPTSGGWTCSSEPIGESAPNITTGSQFSPPQEPDPVGEPSTHSAPDPSDPVRNDLPVEPTPALDPAPTPIDPSGSERVEHTYVKNDGPFKNPLKGWNSGWDGNNDYPESSVGFQYIPWKDFEPSDENYDFAAVEDRLDNAGSKNRHLIIRLYCDWHGNSFESDCPSWMYSDAGVARLKGSNGRYITDFNDTHYIAQAQDAIRALATAYDNDPRFYAVQMGVLGYWGEWHTWGSSFNGGSYEISNASKFSILSTYKDSFSNAKIMARYPWQESVQSANGIGFHNDYFVAGNGHSENFDEAVSAGGQWIHSPIGGEVPPRGGSEASIERNALFSSQTGELIIENGHYSTVKAGAYRVTEGQAGYEGYMRLHKKMGYNYQIDLARFPEVINRAEPLFVELIGTNIGVAPMYFNWDVQFALLDQNNNPVAMNTSNSDLTTILPDSMFNFSSELATNTVNAGLFQLAVRIVQPGADKAKQAPWKLDARNTYILFSNDVPVIDGVWNNNILSGGWSVLGNVTLK